MSGALSLSIGLAALWPTVVSAETVLQGDHRVSAYSTDPGDLTVEGSLHVEGSLDFGTTVETTPQAAVILSYGESGSVYNIDSIATREGVAYRWQENGAAAAKTKMALSADNALWLFAPGYNPANPDTGRISLTPSTSGSGITIDGISVLTTATGNSLYLPLSAAGDFLTESEAATQYVSSADITIGSATKYSTTGPTIALPGGSATGPYSFAGFNAIASGRYSFATGVNSTASGDGSIASGYGSIAGGTEYTVASGYRAIASESYSLASGVWSTASGYASTASGFVSTASGHGSIAAGPFTVAAGCSQFVVGSANVPQGDPYYWIPTDDLFVVGNGISNWSEEYAQTYSNAFTVKKNGVTSAFAVGYNPANPYTGKITMTPDLGGSSITIDGATVLTAATGNSLYIPLTAAGDFLTETEAATQYVSSANYTVGSATQDSITGPTVALPGGIATGRSSFAGIDAVADGVESTATGFDSTATGYGSVATGYKSTASGFGSVASGFNATANGSNSIASGFGAAASGIRSVASGIHSTASGYYSAASGADSIASGIYSTASGYYSAASGKYSTAAGPFTSAFGYMQFVVGTTNIQQGSTSEWIPTDDLFIVGNGQLGYEDEQNYWFDPVPSNAFTVKKNGVASAFAVGYNPANPNTGKIALTPDLGGSSITIDGAAVLTAASGNSLYIPLSAAGDFLTESEAATQYVSSTNFIVSQVVDDFGTGPAIALSGGSATGRYSFAGIGATASGRDSIASGGASTASADQAVASGIGSTASADMAVASGYFSVASGYGSVASGAGSTASGYSSTASGVNSTAIGNYSVAGGPFSVANGEGAIATGYEAIADGVYSTAAGANSTATGHSQFVVGRYNVQQGDPGQWVATDDLFIVGNGTSTTPSNAFVVKKNGDTTVNGKMVVAGPIRIQPAGDLAMGDFTNGPQQ